MSGYFKIVYLLSQRNVKIKMRSEVWGGKVDDRRCGGLTSCTVPGFTYNRHTK
jgi:hypothetical protein